MSTKVTFLDSWKARRIERILNAPESRVLAYGWVKRLLCVVAVVASYADLFGLLISANSSQDDWFMTKNYLVFFTPIVMITAFLLLRKAMRKVTSLPDEYLDEREIANRDWAFKLGYLVVRRIGLGMVVGFLTLAFISWMNQVTNTSWTSSIKVRETAVAKAEVWFQQYVESLLNQSGAIGFGFALFFLLTFVAYSFPIILLTWREAKFSTQHAPVSPKALATMLTDNARHYFVRLLIAGLMLPVFLVVGLLSFGTLTYLAFVWLGFSIYVYFWGLIKMAVAILELKGATRSLRWLFLVTSLVGIWVPVAVWAPFLNELAWTENYGGGLALRGILLFVPAFALIPLQVVSFAVLRIEAQKIASE
jgi:hypothetical protein